MFLKLLEFTIKSSDVNRLAGHPGRASADLGLAVFARFRPGLGLGRAKIGRETKSTKHALKTKNKQFLNQPRPGPGRGRA